MITVYGIANCDTVRKARRWFEGQNMDWQFHDFRKQGLAAETVIGWLRSPARAKLINTRGLSYRELSDSQKAVLKGEDIAAIAEVLIKFPSVIKRPVVVKEGDAHGAIVGYAESDWQKLV